MDEKHYNSEDELYTKNELNELFESGTKTLPEKKIRKKRFDANSNVEEVILDEEQANNIISISHTQFLKLKPKKERTPKQKEQTKKIVDLRKKALKDQKEEEEKQIEERTIKVKVLPKRIRKPKEKVVKPIYKIIEEDDEESEEDIPIKKFQSRKPRLTPEIEEKIQQIEEITNVINTLQFAPKRGFRRF